MPDVCPQGVENLFERQERMASYGPVFCDITWGAGGSTADVTKDIAVRMQNEVRLSQITTTLGPRRRMPTSPALMPS